MRSPQSQAVWSMLAAAGATPIFDDTRAYDVAESQFDQLTLNKAAGNVTLFAKYDVIGINEKAAQQLSPAQMDALRRAAAESTTWAVANVQSDAAMASEFCANGGEIAAATPEQLDEWRAVAKPVIDDLRSVHVHGRPDRCDHHHEGRRRGRAADHRMRRLRGSGTGRRPAAQRHLHVHRHGGGVQQRGPPRPGLHRHERWRLHGDAEGRHAVRDTAIQLRAQGGEQGVPTPATYTLEGDTITFRWSAATRRTSPARKSPCSRTAPSSSATGSKGCRNRSSCCRTR